MIVGFWNTYRQTSMRSNGPNVLDLLEQWMQEEQKPDILVLAEVTRSYQAMIGRMQQSWQDYRIDFVACEDSVGDVSPCSFIYIVSNTYFQSVIPTGGDSQRPILMIPTDDLIVAAVHIIANRDKAPEEVLTACDELNYYSQPGLLIGDMNYPFGDFPRFEQDQLDARRFERVDPGMGSTFGGRAVLDYAFRGPNIRAIEPVPPWPGYEDWLLSDHAPIAYSVTT